MKLSPEATRTHLMVGVILIALALISMIASIYTPGKLLPFLTFFFGVRAVLKPADTWNSGLGTALVEAPESHLV